MDDAMAINVANIMVELSDGSWDAEVEKRNSTNTPILVAKMHRLTIMEVEVSSDGSLSSADQYLERSSVHDPKPVNGPGNVQIGLSFLIVYLLSAIRSVLIAERKKNVHWPYLSILQIVELVKSMPGHLTILEIKDSLFYLIRHCLKVLSSREAPLNALCWKPLVAYERKSRCWAWIGPWAWIAPTILDFANDDGMDVNMLPEWGIPKKTISKLVICVSDWLKNIRLTLRKIADLPPAPPLMLTQQMDLEKRFMEIKPTTSYCIIYPSSEQVRNYFQKEEVLRYSIPDRAFSYTARDGKKSTVVPLINSIGEALAQSRRHPVLKESRPLNLSVISMVRDAVDRLPGRMGTKTDVCFLVRDSQFVEENISDMQLSSIVIRALERLRWENDPCVRFDKNRYLWVYLHGERGLEDFEDDATRPRKKEGQVMAD